MSEVKLLQCPFCGGKKINWVDSINEYTPNVYIYEKYLQCDCCANRSVGVISSKPITEHGKEVLIEKWNTRKPINRIVERLEEEVEYQHEKADSDNGTKKVSLKNARNKMGDCYKHAIEIVNQLAEEHNNGWIACSERLPENDEVVLITIFSHLENKLLVECVRYYQEEWQQPDHGEWAYTTDQILAWQPLPEPYQIEGV